MSCVFISYSHEDTFYAHKLARWLEQAGISVWIDDNIRHGDRWPQTIQENLDKCAAFIVLMTSQSLKSKWVQNELIRAEQKQKTIFPFLLEGENWLTVQSLQYVDVRNADLPPDSFIETLAQILPHEKTPLPVPAQETNSGQGKFRVLIVEDSIDTQQLLADICHEFDTEVEVFGTRIDAIPQVKSGQYDLILLDMQLSPQDISGESGLLLLDLWREYQPQIPLIIVSRLPWDKNQTRNFFKEFAVRDVLDKPINANILRNHLKDLFK